MILKVIISASYHSVLEGNGGHSSEEKYIPQFVCVGLY